MTPPPPASSEPKRLAMERDRPVTHARSLSQIELRYPVRELGLAAEGEPTVTKYEGGLYKLSTDTGQ